MTTIRILLLATQLCALSTGSAFALSCSPPPTFENMLKDSAQSGGVLLVGEFQPSGPPTTIGENCDTKYISPAKFSGTLYEKDHKTSVKDFDVDITEWWWCDHSSPIPVPEKALLMGAYLNVSGVSDKNKVIVRLGHCSVEGLIYPNPNEEITANIIECFQNRSCDNLQE